MTGPSYDDLGALYINCTLKPSPEPSHTQGLIEVSAGIMRKQGIRVETIRAADHDIATGVCHSRGSEPTMAPVHLRASFRAMVLGSLPGRNDRFPRRPHRTDRRYGLLGEYRGGSR